MAGSKVCVLTALSFLIILTTFTGSTQSASCCMRYTSRRFPCQRVLTYSIQPITASCDISAIIFHFSRRFVCVDPLARSTQRVMKCIDERRRKIS